MTAREYAKQVGVEIVGKLTRKTALNTRDDGTEERIRYWIDEAGNEFYCAPQYGGWCCVTAEGGVI